MLSGPSTISETQIKSERTKQLQEDMNLLANRFNTKREISKETSHSQASEDNKSTDTTMQQLPPPPPPPPSFDSSNSTLHRNEHVDAKCTISNKRRSRKYSILFFL